MQLTCRKVERAQRFYVMLQNLYQYLPVDSFEYKSEKKSHFGFNMLQCNRKRKIRIRNNLLSYFVHLPCKIYVKYLQALHWVGKATNKAC